MGSQLFQFQSLAWTTLHRLSSQEALWGVMGSGLQEAWVWLRSVSKWNQSTWLLRDRAGVSLEQVSMPVPMQQQATHSAGHYPWWLQVLLSGLWEVSPFAQGARAALLPASPPFPQLSAGLAPQIIENTALMLVFFPFLFHFIFSFSFLISLTGPTVLPQASIQMYSP
jgi:hypothetical protein